MQLTRLQHTVLDPVVERPDGLHLRRPDGTTRPLRDPSGGVVAGFLPGWRAILLHTGLGQVHLLELEGPGGNRVSWFLTPDGTQLSDRLETLPELVLDLIRARAWRLFGLRCGDDQDLAGVAFETRAAIRALIVPHVLPDPVVRIDDVLFVVGHSEAPLMLRDPHGSAVTAFLEGWHARLLYDGFAPLLLLELAGPGGERRTWFLDQAGRRVADRVHDLPAEMRAIVRRIGGQWRAQAALEGAAGIAAREGFGLLNLETRLELERLHATPGAAAFAEADQRAMAFAAAGVPLRELLHVEPSEASGRAMLGSGWTLRGGEAWMADGSCCIRLPRLPPARHYRLQLDLSAFKAARELSVLLDGRLLGCSRVAPESHSRGARLLFWLPAERLRAQGGELLLVFDRALGGRDLARDQQSPCRLLSLVLSGGPLLATVPEQESAASEAGSGLNGEIRDLLLSFESLGDNCEFGFMQRHYGLEPMGLLRFAGAGPPRNLVTMLEARASGLGKAGSLGTVLFGTEFMIVDHLYGVNYHTFRHQGEVTEAEVIRENEIKLAYLRRKFIEDLEDGEKILIYKRAMTVDQSEILAIQAAILRIAPAARLFWITPACDGFQPGSVQWVAPGLLRGFATRIDLSNAHRFDAPEWVRLCRAAQGAFAGRAGAG